MDNNMEESRTTQNTDYAGPPKSHSFQNNMTDSTKTEPFTLPVQEAPEVEQSKQPVPPHPSHTQDTELLNMISEYDRFETKKTQKKKRDLSLDIKNFLTNFSLKKEIRDFTEKHKTVLHYFNLSWIALKSAFYITGLSFFILCIFLYISFDSLVNDYLRNRKLDGITFEKVDRSLSTIVFTNIKDNKGLFKIAKLKVNFSFADLLEKKIQLVEVDSLNIYLTENKNSAVNFQDLAHVFWQLGFLSNHSLFSIQSVRLEKSALYVNNKEYQLPVNFSGVGSFAKKKHIVFPVNLDTKALKLNGNLTLDLSSSEAMWTLDILSGKLNAFGLSDESLAGQVKTKTSKGKITSTKILGNLTRSGITKAIDIDFVSDQKGAFNARASMIVKGEKTIIAELNLSGIKFDKDLFSFSTEAPLFFKLSNLTAGNFSTDSLQLGSFGLLKCNLNGCSYRITKGAEAIFFTPTYTSYDNKFSVLYPLKVPFKSTAKDTFSMMDKKFSYDVDIAEVGFAVRRKNSYDGETNTSISLLDFISSGSYDFEKRKWAGNFATKIHQIKEDSFVLSDGSMEMSFADTTYKTGLKAKNLLFPKASYFKLPIQIDTTLDSDNYFTASVNSLDNWISVGATGYFQPTTGEILMATRTNKPIVFTKDSPAISEITSLLSPKIKNLSGNLSFKGEVHFANSRSVSGPLQVLLDDVSFDYGNMHVKNVTSLMNLTQIIPFGTQAAQDVHAQSITAIFPFKDVNAQIFFDATKEQFNISSMSTNLAGYSLRVDPMWYPYNASLYTISLRGKTAPIQPVLDHMTLNNLKIAGNGNINITGLLEGDKFSLKNSELSIVSDGRLEYTPNQDTNTDLKGTKRLDFKRLSIYMTPQENGFELIFSADNKLNKIKKKTNFRFDINDTLEKYFLPTQPEPLPAALVEAKENF